MRNELEEMVRRNCVVFRIFRGELDHRGVLLGK